MTPNVRNNSDYSPFGSLMLGRHGTADTYRYGFNGMLKDDEIKNVEGSSYDFGARMYDSRVGRWLSCDAFEAKYPFLSPYNFVANNPLIYIDKDGNELYLYGDKDGLSVEEKLSHLQKLTNDKLDFDRQTGKVFIVQKCIENAEKDLPTGSMLIRELIKTNVKIEISNSFVVNETVNEPSYTGSDGKIPVAIRVRVSFEKTITSEVQDKLTGEIKISTTPLEIKLAHELIHAYYGSQGKQENHNSTTYYYTGNCKISSNLTDEIKTAGIPFDGDKNGYDYNENLIREEQGYDKRTAY